MLTTAQVVDVAFAGARRARIRLSELHDLELLDRFRPITPARPLPYHWVLGPLGAALVAYSAGRDPTDLAWRRTLTTELATSQRLGHLVGLNGLFCSLLRSARTRAGCDLAEWWSERRCAAEWGEVVRPDGYGIWREGHAALAFLVEYDNSSERLGRLAGKLDGYQALAEEAGHPNWVCFSFATPRREAEARRVLTHPSVPVATSSRAAGRATEDAIWLPVKHPGRRLRLIELATAPICAR